MQMVREKTLAKKPGDNCGDVFDRDFIFNGAHVARV